MINNRSNYKEKGSSTAEDVVEKPWDNCSHDWAPVGICATNSSYPQGEVASSIFCKKCGYIIIRKQ